MEARRFARSRRQASFQAPGTRLYVDFVCRRAAPPLCAYRRAWNASIRLLCMEARRQTTTEARRVAACGVSAASLRSRVDWFLSSLSPTRTGRCGSLYFTVVFSCLPRRRVAALALFSLLPVAPFLRSLVRPPAEPSALGQSEGLTTITKGTRQYWANDDYCATGDKQLSDQMP